MHIGSIIEMKNSKLHTIEAHEKIIPNRFELARLIMLRTRALISGSPIKPGVDPVLLPRRHDPLPNSRAPKIALDEVLNGSTTFIRPSVEEVKAEISESDIVFTPIN